MIVGELIVMALAAGGNRKPCGNRVSTRPRGIFDSARSLEVPIGDIYGC